MSSGLGSGFVGDTEGVLETNRKTTAIKTILPTPASKTVTPTISGAGVFLTFYNFSETLRIASNPKEAARRYGLAKAAAPPEPNKDVALPQNRYGQTLRSA